MASEEMKMPEAQEPHRWLARLVGDWTYTVESVPGGTEAPPEKWTGRETVRALGNVWVVLEAQGDGEFADGKSIMTLGYDPVSERYTGSWIGSMMTHFWTYDGHRSEDGNALFLESEGPDMEREGETGRYRDEIVWEGDDVRRLKAHWLTPSGEWKHFMTTRYERR